MGAILFVVIDVWQSEIRSDSIFIDIEWIDYKYISVKWPFYPKCFMNFDIV